MDSIRQSGKIQGRDLRLNASKGIGVLGRGPDLSYISILPQVAAGGAYRTTIIGMNAGSATVSADFLFLQNIPPPCASVGSPLFNRAAPLPVTVDGEQSASFIRTAAPHRTERLGVTFYGIPMNGD